MIFRKGVLLTALCTSAWIAPAKAAVTEPGFEEAFVASGLLGITGIAWAPDASQRLFVTTRAGAIRIVENGKTLAESFATLPQVYAASECGLIGIAFDPDYVSNGYVYVFVTVSASEQQIVRYRDVGNIGTDLQVIVRGLPTLGRNHDGGAVGFGPDGKLYWAIGDNGARVGVNGDLTSLAAKVGRANRDGSTPNDNPFFDGDGANNDFIWARGFRNPFSFTFQPSTGHLWVSVAGTAFEQIFEVGRGDHAGWNTYEGNQPAGFIAPKIVYGNDAVNVRNVAADGAVRLGNVATFTTVEPHLFQSGAKITISGVTDSSFDGTGYVAKVAAPNVFTIQQSLPDATSGGGSAASQAIGGAVTGAAFWDSSAVPTAYRGNLFFGDYNTGNLMRATLDTANQVTSVDQFGSGQSRYTDMEVGPDGDLYVARYAGGVYRARYLPAVQGIVVSKLNVRLAEGGAGAFGVRLALAPSAPKVVVSRRFSGDVDVGVASGANLAFDASNWSVPQPVRLAAGQDADSVDDLATLVVTSAGLPTERVLVRVTDDDPVSIQVSRSSLTVAEGEQAAFEVSLSQRPPTSVEVALSVAAADVVTLSEPRLTFTPAAWSTPQVVQLSAVVDDDPLDESATVVLSADGYQSREVGVLVADQDALAPVFSSMPNTTAVLGTEYGYDARADGRPPPSFQLLEGPAGMTVDSTSGMVTWVASGVGSFAVELAASNGVAPDALQSFQLQVLADEPPECEITAPKPGTVLSGELEEFFGDVRDDVGPVSAVFLVDGDVLYEDVNDEGHYHAGGGHGLFDTTQYDDGDHVLSLVGTDTAGLTCRVDVDVLIDNASRPGQARGGAGAGGRAGEGEVSSGGSGAGGTVAVEGGASDGGSSAEGAGASAGDALAMAGAPGSEHDTGSDDGCSCRVASTGRPSAFFIPALGALGLVLRRARRARASCAHSVRA